MWSAVRRIKTSKTISSIKQNHLRQEKQKRTNSTESKLSNDVWSIKDMIEYGFKVINKESNELILLPLKKI